MNLRKALPGFSAGALTILMVIFGVWPALAQSRLLAPRLQEPVPSQEVAPQEEEQPNAPAFGDDEILSVPAAAFSPDGASFNAYQFVTSLGPLGGGYLVGRDIDGNNPGCMQAPVYFPSGVSIDQMTMYYYDNITTDQVLVRLYQKA